MFFKLDALSKNGIRISLRRLVKQLENYFFKFHELSENAVTISLRRLVKELENHNFFIVFQDDDLPSNYSLVSEYNWCVLFWNNMGIEDYTFFVMEYPDEFKIYLHKTTSEIRQYSEPISEPIKSCSLKTDIGEVFEKTVTDYMVDVFWYELEHALEVGGGQKFIEEMEASEFSKEFNMGAFFNFDGIDLPKRIKEKAFQKILQNVEDSPDEV